MTKMNRLATTYGLKPSQLLVNPIYPSYMIDVGGTLLYGQVVPNVLDGKKVFVFAYDSLVTEKLLDLQKSLPFVGYQSPALEFDLRKQKMDEIVAAIKTKKSLLTGTKSGRITTEVFNPTERELFKLIEHKQRSYDDAHLAYEIFLEAQGYEMQMMRGKVDGVWAWTMLFMVNRETRDVCGTTITLSENKDVRKYSPYIQGHYRLVAWAEYNKFDTVRFSAFFDYKKIFGQAPVMYPTVDPKDVTAANGFIPMRNKIEEHHEDCCNWGQ